MADDALVKLIVEAGVDAWNRSRVSHPNYPQCDIYEEAQWGADLSGANLSNHFPGSALFLGADLRGANIIAPALKKREELRRRKVDVRPTRSIDDYL